MGDGVIARPRLLDVLSRQDSKICVVTAPSGFGKTTLLRSWAKAVQDSGASVTIVWIALSSEATTRHAFWQAVAVSAQRYGHLDSHTGAALVHTIEAHDDPVSSVASFLRTRGEMVLVFDAYENLRGLTPEIDSDILRLTEQVPNLRIVVTTRAATSLADDVLELRGRVRKITERHLQFTAEETAQLLNEHAPHVDQVATDLIHRETRGYPLAIRAAAFALAQRRSTPTHGTAQWRALVTKDLKSQLSDPATIEFIFDTCAPPYFDASLARSLTGSSEVQKVLDELEWHGFGRWIPYAQNRPVFQYVESLRDTFRNELLTTDHERYIKGAASSAQWLHDNADHEIALGLAIEAKQYELASTITTTLIVTSPESYSSDGLEKYLRHVPRAVLPHYPFLAFALGLAHLTTLETRASAGEYFFLVATHGAANIQRMAPTDAFFALSARALSLRYIGRFEESGAEAARALSYFDSMAIEHHDGFPEFKPLVFRQLAYSLFQVGEVEQARATMSRAVTSATTTWSKNYTLAYGVGLHAVAGYAHHAESTRRMVDPDAWPRDHEHSIMNGLGVVGAATLRLDAFDCSGALDDIAMADSYIHTTEFWPLFTWATMNARLGLGEAWAEAHRIEEALASTPVPLGVGSNLGTAAVEGMLAILWLSTGQLAKASALLEQESNCPGQFAPAQLLHLILSGETEAALRELPGLTAKFGHTIRSRAATLTLGAVAALREGNKTTATSLLERAAALSHSHGARAHLMYVPAADLEQLRAIAATTAKSMSIDYLAGAIASPIVGTTEFLALSDGELVVLRAVAEHRTQAEAAKALYLSSNTIKTHLKSIYRKLGVDSRKAAIQRAIEVGLL